ncbi:MAG: hypothetical protein F6K40_15005 [Okeania sp. SIO3I5]|uniref:hypothetical protein n=1 Tax=Okeania sp. SIO3I5 TaxID=2607805 RepID=UPI0013B740DD|nr:hypothetical protein [Okeania sp. SIO3I5]NEQ37506.1 hypothetical protein [Okeania sp. SIO3I5]
MKNYVELSYLIDAISVYELERNKRKQLQQINLSEKTQIIKDEIIDKYLPCFSRVHYIKSG